MANRPNPILEDLARIRRELTALSKMKIHIGIQGDEDSELLMIAGVHEYGATIKAKKAKNLAIPLKPWLKDKSPRDINNTWILRTDDGDVFIVRDKGKDEIEFLFMLLPTVHIPERSFIRGSYDSGKQGIEATTRMAVDRIIKGEWTAQQAAENIGLFCVQMTQEYFNTKLKPKSNITMASTNQEAPLVESGRLYQSITFKVEGGE